jgi:uncharacterized protein YndB with AHSA1/START domain
MTSMALPHTLTRSVLIQAPPETVFRFFTDSARWASWWGSGSTIDASPGGRAYIRHPDGTESAGEVVEVSPPRRFVFTYGYVKGAPLPVGASRVTIQLYPVAEGTRLDLEHAFADADASARDEHEQGWRYGLSLFANVVSNEVNADAAAMVDDWFGAWAEPDAESRERTLRRICTPDVRVQDRFSNLEGIADLLPHVAAAQKFMPGMRMSRAGDAKHCQGVVVAAWSAQAADGQSRGTGTNVFLTGPDGRIERVTGLWA